MMRNFHSTISQQMNATFQNILANPQTRDFMANITRAIGENSRQFFNRMMNS